MARSEGQIVTRKVNVKLTEQELLECGERMSQCELRIENYKGERNGVNAKIKEQTEERNKLAHMIESEVEEREVECKWVKDFTANLWKLNRVDTGATVESRTMTPEDRQESIDFPTDDEDDGEFDGQGDDDDYNPSEEELALDAEIEAEMAETPATDVERVSQVASRKRGAAKKKSKPKAAAAKGGKAAKKGKKTSRRAA